VAVGLADRLGSQLGEYPSPSVDAQRERVTVALDDIVRLLGEADGFLIGQFKVHFRDMGSGLPSVNPLSRHAGANPPAARPG
jgi:hypothetical protein